MLLPGCGASEKAKKQAEQLNALSEKRAAADTLFSMALQDADQAIAAKDQVGVSKAVSSLQGLGEEAVSGLTDIAKNDSSSHQSRLTALILLGEIGERAQSAVGALVEMQEKDTNSDIRKAADETLVKIRKKP